MMAVNCRPCSAAGWYQLSVDSDGKHSGDSQRPDSEDDETCKGEGTTAITRCYRAADSHTSISTHRCQSEGSGDRARRRHHEIHLKTITTARDKLIKLKARKD